MSPSRRASWLYAALGLYCAMTLGLYLSASWGARPVIDDAWGILRRADEGLWPTVWHALTQPTYATAALPGGLNGAPASAGYAWGPLPTLVQAGVAAVFGRESLTPFRVVNVIAHACGALGLAGALRASGLLLPAGAPIPVGTSLIGCAAAVAFFLTHPVAAECVPWASDLFDVLGAAALTCGLWAAARTTTPAGYAGASAAGVLAACLCKPTAAPLCLMYPLWAAATGRGRAAALNSAAASLCTAALALLWYAEVSQSHMAAQAFAALISSDDARTTFALSYGLSILDAVRPLAPPAVMRYLIPAIDGPRALAGAAAVILAIGLLAIARYRSLPGTRWLAAALALWLVGLVPGSLIAVALGTHGARYSLLPLAAALPFAVRAFATVFGEGTRAPRWAPAVLGALLAVALVGNLRWLAVRIPDYAGDVAFFTAEAGNPEFAVEPAAGPRLAVFAAQAAFFASVDPAAPASTNPCVAGLAYVEAIDRLGSGFAAAQPARYQRVATLLSGAGERASPTACGSDAHAALFRGLSSRLAAQPDGGP